VEKCVRKQASRNITLTWRVHKVVYIDSTDWKQCIQTPAILKDNQIVGGCNLNPKR
jgi:hypothetical protein